MKAFEDLTRLGKLRRIRQLARAALAEYDLPASRIHFLRHAGNTMFRIADTCAQEGAGARADGGAGRAKEAGDVFAAGQYLLRIHQPGYQTTDAIALELEWLAALRDEARAPVPEPVPTLMGGLLTQVTAPGVPEARDCSLLRWVKGRMATGGIRAEHYRAQGRLMAILHNHAATWRLPEDHVKRRYDWNGLFRDDGGSGIPASEAWTLLPPAYVRPFRTVARRVKRLMTGWGDGPDVYGMIHGDLGVDANVLFHRGDARAIDFDDSGTGYWIYDLAIALEHCREDAAFPEYREALLEGYREIRPLPEEHSRHLDLFLVAFQVYWSLWAAAMVKLHPEHQDALLKRMKRAARLVDRYLAGRCEQ